MVHDSSTTIINKGNSWRILVSAIVEEMPELQESREFILNHRLCRLIGMLPFIAGTDQPFRDGYSNLSLFLRSKYTPVKEIYKYTIYDNEDIMYSLISCCHFSGGDEKILSRGMHLVAMVLLKNYKMNMDQDLDHNRYNPLNSGQWDYDSIMETLRLCVESISCPEMDEILSLSYIPFTPWALGA